MRFMSRGVSALVLLAGFTAAAPSAARRVRVQVIKKLSVEQRRVRPTFTPARDLRFMERGELLYLGSGLWDEHSVFHFLKLADLTRITRAAPIGAFLRADPKRFPGPHDHKGYRVRQLLFHDTKNRQAGILLAETRRRSDRRLLLLRWDLAKNAITGAELLGDRKAGSPYLHIKVIGYVPDRQTLYLQQVRSPRRGLQLRKVSILAISTGGKKTLAAFEASRPISRGPHHDPARGRALVVEYAERGLEGPGPTGYLVDLSTGKITRMAFPLTTYGVAFAPDGKRIHAYSAQTGKLWSIDAATGKRLRRVHIGGLGHAMGIPFDNTLVIVRNKGLQLVDERRLSKRQFVPIKKIYPGFSHVQGSIVTPRMTVIKNRRTLHLVAFRRWD